MLSALLKRHSRVMKKKKLLRYKFLPGMIFLLLPFLVAGQRYVSKVWVADNGNGTYKNPVIHADYSDPDAIRVGDDYYMISSSFSDVPGLPILHSKDLVNWSIIGHALKRIAPPDHYSVPQHGNGVWAPAIRFHNGEFYIYYPDPDFGIYLTKSKSITGPWSDPVLVEGGKGLIDPCPLWDDDGKVYLVHALAGSRAGIKSVIIVKQMNTEGTKTIEDGIMVYDGHQLDPTIEGPKFYKRHGYYYIFAPAGGVSTGWQLVLRSKNVYGPYERKVVMDKGATHVNGPHQGAWVTTQTGQDWFIHFQDKEAYGRVVHLQPMKWINDWPVIGADMDADGKGEPVLVFKKPNVGKVYPVAAPLDADEFNGSGLGLQWQWHANPKPYWRYMTGEALRLFSCLLPDSSKNLWDIPNLLLQKFPSNEFTATIKVSFRPRLEGEKFGFTVFGLDYAYLSLSSQADGIYLGYASCKQADKGKPEASRQLLKVTGDVYLRVNVSKGAVCSFSYSIDGNSYVTVNEQFTAKPGKWIGAKIGFFCTGNTKTNDAGWAEIDWLRIAP
jgi:beta-xylosidase